MTRNETIAFLNCVLPGEGFYCAVAFDTAHPKPGIDRPRQKFFQFVEDLADYVLSADQQGKTTYHACASYRNTKSRTQANALLARSLWIDIDCGISQPNRPPKYADQETAAREAILFCNAVRIPLPLFVSSGGGIHCYWPLAQAISPDQWHVLASKLKAATARHGLRVDPARTADVASILRTPGTHNRKEGELLVQFDPEQLQQHELSAFDTLAIFANGDGAPAPAISSRRPAAGPQPGSTPAGTRARVIDRANAAVSYASVYADTVADRCNQLRAFRQSGDIPEPEWYACLGVLSRCVDGATKAHEWSANGFADYDAAETQQRYERSLELTGATTCAKFAGINPEGCNGCPYAGRINSPISVPSDPLDVRATAPRQQRTPFNGSAQNGHHSAAAFIPTVGEIQLPKLRDPFHWGKQGKMLLRTENNNGDAVDVVISDFPVYLDTVQTGELDPTRFSYKLNRWLPQEGWKDIVIDAKLMFGSSGSAELADRGVVLHEHKHFLNYVRHAVTEFHEEEETHVRYDQFGWKNDDTSFLYGSMLHTAAGPVRAIGAKEVTTRSQWIGPRAGGNLYKWTDAADSLFAKDMEAYSSMMLASFAAPLMRFQSQDEGGAIMHLFTPGSGQGKTTALTGAWSVWGTREGLSLTNDDTRVSKPIAIGTLGNLPVIWDELHDKDPEMIKRFVTMFTEGRDRMRGTVDGTIRHTKATWQTILLSAANQSIVEQLTGDGVDAPSFRVLELTSQLPSSIDKTKGDRLKKILNDNAGHAGEAYLRYITQPEVLAWVRSALETWTQEIWNYTGAPSAYRFRVRAVGAMAVAATIVNKLDLLHFNTDRILMWLLGQIRPATLEGVTVKTDMETAVNAFGTFFNQHLAELLIVPDKFKPRTAPMLPIRAPLNKLSIRYEIRTNRVFIAESVFREWVIKRGYSTRHLMEQLEISKIVISRRRLVTLSAGTNIPGAQVSCMEINAGHPIMSGLLVVAEDLEQFPSVDVGQSH